MKRIISATNTMQQQRHKAAPTAMPMTAPTGRDELLLLFAGSGTTADELNDDDDNDDDGGAVEVDIVLLPLVVLPTTMLALEADDDTIRAGDDEGGLGTAELDDPNTIDRDELDKDA